MIGILKMDLYRALWNWKLALSIVATAVIYLTNSDWQLFCGFGSNYYICQSLEVVEGFGMGGKFVMMLMVLPYACSMMEDFKNHEWVSLMLRSGKQNYLYSKIIVCILAGGIAASGGMFLYVFLLKAVCGMRLTYPVVSDMDYGNYLGNLIGHGNWLSYYLCKGFLYFGMGAVISLLGLFWSIICANEYVVVALPYILLSLIDILPFSIDLQYRLESVWHGINEIRSVSAGLLFALGYYGMLLLVLSLGISVLLRRKINGS